MIVALGVFVLAIACGSHHPTLPPILKDEEFWQLSARLSEPPGVFTHSENLVSNELHFVHSLHYLGASRGVYIGVGPEQNFSYIAGLRPDLAFIIDIRRENRNLHLLYKALFEMSTDRADFVSRLFSRERPSGLDANATVEHLFAAFAAKPPAAGLYETNRLLVHERLTAVRSFPMTDDDRHDIDRALHAFLTHGPDITYGQPSSEDSPRPSYRSLMTARDISGETHSYLASEERFAAVKALQASNLLVPVVGDFAGPTAIRRVGEYVREHGSLVSAFYGSNVEVYLNQTQRGVFCANLATLPHRERSWFIGSKGMRLFTAKLKSCISYNPSSQ